MEWTKRSHSSKLHALSYTTLHLDTAMTKLTGSARKNVLANADEAEGASGVEDPAGVEA